MKNDPVKLLFKADSQFPGIIPNPIRTNVDFSQDRAPWLRKIKSDDIGIVIMF